MDTFRALLSSHVALLLVDAQKLLDNAGEEQRYLKSLLGNFRNSLLLLKDDLLEDGKPLVVFPRIWVIALSKADVLPDVDVHKFKELVIEKVGDDLVDLRSVLGAMIESEDALSVGEDFVRISSAKFTTDTIEVNQRMGIDLILPMAAVMPLERHIRWAKASKVSKKVTMELLEGAEVVASALGVAGKVVAYLLGKQNKVAATLGFTLSKLSPSLEDAVKSAGAKLAEADAAASTKQENLARTLGRFQRELDDAEEQAVLARSPG